MSRTSKNSAIEMVEAKTGASYDLTRYDLLPMLDRNLADAIDYAMHWGLSESEAREWATCPKMLVDVGNDGDYEVCGNVALHRTKGADDDYYTVTLYLGHDVMEHFIEERGLSKGKWAYSWFDAWELSDNDCIDLLTMRLMSDWDYLHDPDYEDQGSYYPEWLY